MSQLIKSQTAGGDVEFVSGEARVRRRSAEAAVDVGEEAGPSTLLLTKTSSPWDEKKMNVEDKGAIKESRF